MHEKIALSKILSLIEKAILEGKQKKSYPKTLWKSQFFKDYTQSSFNVFVVVLGVFSLGIASGSLLIILHRFSDKYPCNVYPVLEIPKTFSQYVYQEACLGVALAFFLFSPFLLYICPSIALEEGLKATIENSLKQIKDTFFSISNEFPICVINMNIMSEPVCIIRKSNGMKIGGTYEREALRQWFETKPTIPTTGERYQKEQFIIESDKNAILKTKTCFNQLYNDILSQFECDDLLDELRKFIKNHYAEDSESSLQLSISK